MTDTPPSRRSPLLNVAELAEIIDAPDVRLLDATWFASWTAPAETGAEAFLRQRLPGARFFDIDDIADDSTELPHMVPSAAKWASRLKSLGVGDGHRIIVYDANRGFASARVWWMMRYFGVQEVAVLDGGLRAWLTAGQPVETGPVRIPSPRHLTPRLQSHLHKDKAQVNLALTLGRVKVIDARPAARFRGEVDEPRPGLARGHMPGAVNLSADQVLDVEGFYLPAERLQQVFAQAGHDVYRPFIASCGSGVSAALLLVAAAICGQTSAALYDGSWSEWGGDPTCPVATSGQSNGPANRQDRP